MGLTDFDLILLIQKYYEELDLFWANRQLFGLIKLSEPCDSEEKQFLARIRRQRRINLLRNCLKSIYFEGWCPSCYFTLPSFEFTHLDIGYSAPHRQITNPIAIPLMRTVVVHRIFFSANFSETLFQVQRRVLQRNIFLGAL